MKKAIVLGFAALTMLAVSPVQAGNHCTTTKVDLHIKKNELKVTPVKAKCVISGGAFIITVKPSGAAPPGAITVEEKKSDGPLTIEGDNSDNPDQVVVQVSGSGNPDVDYGYIVRVSGHGVLDPEVRVVSSRMFMMTALEETNALLEEVMGFDLDGLAKMQAEYDEVATQAE